MGNPKAFLTVPRQEAGYRPVHDRIMDFSEVEEVEWTPGAEGERPVMKPTGKKEILKADLVLLAMGFLRPVQPEFPANVFVAGDAATGASLVVKCIAGGRKAAADIDAYLSRK
jgi:glutamate synthase (NADPH) small chain